MPPPYDAVISIGGQSLVDGVWRLLGPALEGLSNPLPVVLPGFSNATMRITRIIPAVPGAGGLEALATVELSAEALLSVNVTTDSVSISLGPQQLEVTKLAGTIDLPALAGTLTNVFLGGTYPPPIGRVDLGQTGAGAINLPPSTAKLGNGSFSATLKQPSQLTLPGIPFPAVVPVALDFTPSLPLFVNVVLQPTASGFSQRTCSGLVINAGASSIGAVALDPALDPTLLARVTASLQAAVNQIVQQLGLPLSVAQTPVSAAAVSALLAPVPKAVRSALGDAFSLLLGETGRLIYPPAGTGASCDVAALPTAGDARLVVAGNNTYVLQLGFRRAQSGDIAAFPASLPFGPADTTLLVGNEYLLELLCCLVRRLPAFTFPVDASSGNEDINSAGHLKCCNFEGATVEFGPFALGGGLSVCIDDLLGDGQKTPTLVGHFAQETWAAEIKVDFTLPLALDLDDSASLTNLHVHERPGVSADVKADIIPTNRLLILIAALGVLLFSTALGAVATVLVYAVCAVAEGLLRNFARTILRAASPVRSPAAVPPGVFEAFGKLVPTVVRIDDLTARSVLQTPTSPWALRPRLGVEPPDNTPPVG